MTTSTSASGTHQALAAPPAPAADAARRTWRRLDERALVLLGAALVALHVADDRFLQPPAGTSATDHLAGGLVPMALLAAAAWCHGRARAGWRGLIALSAGVFGAVIGALEAGYYSVAIGPTGDDFTGLLAIPAGLLLVGVGAATLWRSRRRDGSLRRRVLRRALLGAAGVVAGGWLGGCAGVDDGGTGVPGAGAIDGGAGSRRNRSRNWSSRNRGVFSLRSTLAICPCSVRCALTNVRKPPSGLHANAPE